MLSAEKAGQPNAIRAAVPSNNFLMTAPLALMTEYAATMREAQ
jgi:hypothetical protein